MCIHLSSLNGRKYKCNSSCIRHSHESCTHNLLILSLFFERFLKFIMWNCTLLVNFIITNQIDCNIVSSRIFSFLFPNAIIEIIRVDKIRFVINCYCSDSQIVGSLIIVFYSTQHWLRLET